ncbi:MAG: hypothetical protein AAF587_20460 [Bacteroidota bacterium]
MQYIHPYFPHLICAITAFLILSACDSGILSPDAATSIAGTATILILDEESIDNGNAPNDFSDIDVNDQIADIGLRLPLTYFQEHIGEEIDLYTGQVGDEGWFALRTIPADWDSTGPQQSGLENYLQAGPGLGTGKPDDDREILLDNIPDVTPLRATGLSLLLDSTVLAVVYDSDVMINYSPLTGSLMGANLGLVAFDVLEVTKREDGSDSSLPKVKIRIRDVADVQAMPLRLFHQAPVPTSSSDPFDIGN